MVHLSRSEYDSIDKRSWITINECLEDASNARNLNEFYVSAVAGAERLVPCDIGACCFRFENGLPRWVKGGPDKMGNQFNEYYRYHFPTPISAVIEPVPWTVFPARIYDATKYVQEYLRPHRVGSILGTVEGRIHLAILREPSETQFNLVEASGLKVLSRQLEGLHRWILHTEKELRCQISRDPAGHLPKFLSPREAEIVNLVDCGYSAKDIGLALDISPRTAERHLANAYEKMGLRSRSELHLFLHPAPEYSPQGHKSINKRLLAVNPGAFL